MEARRWLLASAFCLAASGLSARPADDPVALSNWAAPPYWMSPTQRARATEAKGLEGAAAVNPALAFHAVTPCRIADTRGFGFTGPYGPPNLTAGAVRSFAVTSPGTSCGIPPGVAAVSFNFAVVNLAANGNLVVYPTGAPVPTVSTLNWTPVELAISNAAVVALGSDSISVVVNGPVGSTVDLVIDVNGYYAAEPPLVLVGDVTGSPFSNVVASVGGSSASNVHAAEVLANAATFAATANTIVRRDGSANVQVHRIAASGGYTQPGTGGESLKIIRGVFFCSPISILTGTGYTAVRNAIGNYTVTFSTAFVDAPAFQVTGGGGTAQIATLSIISGASITFITKDLTGAAADFNAVSFTAIGAAP